MDHAKEQMTTQKEKHLEFHKSISERILLFWAKDMFLKTLVLFWINSTTIQRYTDQFFESQARFYSFQNQIVWERSSKRTHILNLSDQVKWVGVLIKLGDSVFLSKNFKNRP